MKKIEPDMLCWFHSETGNRLMVRTIGAGNFLLATQPVWFVEFLSFGKVWQELFGQDTGFEEAIAGGKGNVLERQLTPIPPDELEAMGKDATDIDRIEANESADDLVGVI